MYRVLIDQDYVSRNTALVSGNILSPIIDTPLMAGSSDYQNTAVIVNLPDGTIDQSPATVSQLNVGISGLLTGDPFPNYVHLNPEADTRNVIAPVDDSVLPLRIHGAGGGHLNDLQEWVPDNDIPGTRAYIDQDARVFGVGLDAQSNTVTNVANPVVDTDAVPKGWLGNAREFDVGTLSGTIAMGHHVHPFMEDFIKYTDIGTEWSETTTGSAVAWVQSVPTADAFVRADQGDGYLRMTSGAGSTTADRAFWRPKSYTAFGEIFHGTGRRYIWRSSLNSVSTMSHSFGIMTGSNVASGLVPYASFVFVFDSAYTNVRFAHSDGQGNATDQDTGVALSTYSQLFNWAEIAVVSGAVTAYINGVQVATVTSNHPVGVDRIMYPFMFSHGNGTTWRSIYHDIFLMHGDDQRFLDGIYT